MKTSWAKKHAPGVHRPHELRAGATPRTGGARTGGDGFERAARTTAGGLRAATSAAAAAGSSAPAATGSSVIGARLWVAASNPAPSVTATTTSAPSTTSAWSSLDLHGTAPADALAAHAQPVTTFHPELSNTALSTAIRQAYAPTTHNSYSTARHHLFSYVHNDQGHVRCVYTHRDVVTNDIPAADDGPYMNTEHTFPKSWLKGNKAAVSDLHHLFPTDTKTNEMRSSYPFGEVVTPEWVAPGGAAQLGQDAQGHTVFEPPDDHKGNVARAMFYVSTVYDLHLSAQQEEVLRAWSVADPVDAREKLQNARIAEVQGNRNPFVDEPALADRIADF